MIPLFSPATHPHRRRVGLGLCPGPARPLVGAGPARGIVIAFWKIVDQGILVGQPSLSTAPAPLVQRS